MARMYPEPTGEVRMSLSLRFAAGSHKGMIREGNEDSGYAGPRLLAIADGMGGQAAGEVASLRGDLHARPRSTTTSPAPTSSPRSARPCSAPTTSCA